MSDHAVRLRAVLADLENGSVGLPEAAARVRALRFPHPPRKGVGQQMADATGSDMPPRPQPGGFHEVEKALIEGKITHRQYEVLAEAASDAGRNTGDSLAHTAYEGQSRSSQGVFDDDQEE